MSAKIIPIKKDYRDSIIKNPNMTKYLEITLLIVISVILFSCGGKKKGKTNEPPPKEEAIKIVAVITKPDGTKELQIVMRVIKIDTVTTSKGEKVEIIDTIWGKEKLIPDTDLLGNPKKDSTGKQVLTLIYVMVSKDSVYTDIANKSVDSLTKKNQPN